MPNPVPAKYTVQLGPTVTPEVAGELAAWAELLGRSISEVTRGCVEVGLAHLRDEFVDDVQDRREDGRQTRGEVRAKLAEILPAHVTAAQQRGERQVARRRGYDERTRKTGGEATAESGATDAA